MNLRDPLSVSLLIHIAIGTLGLLFYWSALLSKKGSLFHKNSGRIFLVVLIGVSISVAPVLYSRTGKIEPPFIVQMVYLVTCLCTVSFLAWSAIRWKKQPERFRGTHLIVLGSVLFALGVFVLFAGLIGGDPVAVVLSWVGLVFGPTMIAFFREGRPLHPRWWLIWHLNSVSALFNAVHGTLLYVVAVYSGMVGEGVFGKVFFQIVTIAGAVAMRLYFGSRFNVPLGFTADKFQLAEPPKSAAGS